jgi:bifunctional non-homologous end joining protein LigD
MKSATCQLATDSDFATVAALGHGWTFEPKLDGHRLLVSRAGCWTRSGRAVSYPHIEAACPEGALLDCELVTAGRSTASRVQSAVRSGRVATLTAVAFDVLEVGGASVGHLPQRERRERLVGLGLQGALSTIASYADAGDAMAASAEGIIAKRADAPYVHARTDDWLKAKWQYHRDGSSVDWLHDEIDWSAVEAGALAVTRTTERLYK